MKSILLIKRIKFLAFSITLLMCNELLCMIKHKEDILCKGFIEAFEEQLYIKQQKLFKEASALDNQFFKKDFAKILKKNLYLFLKLKNVGNFSHEILEEIRKKIDKVPKIDKNDRWGNKLKLGNSEYVTSRRRYCPKNNTIATVKTSDGNYIVEYADKILPNKKPSLKSILASLVNSDNARRIIAKYNLYLLAIPQKCIIQLKSGDWVTVFKGVDRQEGKQESKEAQEAKEKGSRYYDPIRLNKKMVDQLITLFMETGFIGIGSNSLEDDDSSIILDKQGKLNIIYWGKGCIDPKNTINRCIISCCMHYFCAGELRKKRFSREGLYYDVDAETEKLLMQEEGFNEIVHEKSKNIDTLIPNSIYYKMFLYYQQLAGEDFFTFS